MLKKGKVWPWFCFPSAEWRAPRRRRGLVPIPSPMLAEEEEEGSLEYILDFAKISTFL